MRSPEDIPEARRIERLAEGVTLYLGDCRELLGRLPKVDAVVTDPPYGKNERTNRKSNGRDVTGRLKSNGAGWAKDYPPIEGDDQPFDPSHLLGYRKIILFGGNWFSSRLPDASQWIVWDKREQTPADDNADCELAWTNLGGPTRMHRQLWRGICRRGEENIAAGEGRSHPTQKPIALMAFCLEACRLTPGDTVLDPYMGTGATGVAAVRRCLKFIGIEKEREYFDIACRRISEALKQPDMFIAPPKPAVQVEMAYDRTADELPSLKAASTGRLGDRPAPSCGTRSHEPNLPAAQQIDIPYDPVADVEGSFNDAYAAVRERMAKGGKGWQP